MGDLFSDYDDGGFFDEVFDRDGVVRPHYRGVVERLRGFTPEDLDRRERIRDQLFRSQGITFTVYGDDDGRRTHLPDGPAAADHPGRASGRSSSAASPSG